MKERIAGSIRLSTTTKLGCLAFGVPPCVTCPIKGQVCRVCYAKYGTASFANVSPVLHANMELVAQQTVKKSSRQIADQLQDEQYFRWLWAGDAHTTKMVSVILETASMTPKVKHWVASRNAPIWKGVDLPKNVTLRISSPMMNDFSGQYGSTSLSPKAIAPDSIFECPGDCRKCRFCWQKKTKQTPAYRFHGSAVSHCIYKKFVRLGELPE
jgi:hypothetical protein